MKKEIKDERKVELFVGDLFKLPLKDNSIDIVYTFHALEPNGGNEKPLIRELYRIARKYLIFIEPSFEIASEEGKERMIHHGYIMNLQEHINSLGYEIIKIEPFGLDANPMNPAQTILVKKCNNDTDNNNVSDPLCDPITGSDLERIGNALYSPEALLSYPIINGVPCLLENYAVVTTKMKQYQ